MSKFYLKDWHGKEKEFTDDKIFVRGENGELIQFTQGEGDKPAVVQPLEVTENGTYTAPDGVDGYSPVTVNVQGGGGDGSLPAGIYWSGSEYKLPNHYTQSWFMYNGELHALTNTMVNASSEWKIYKMTDGAWGEVASGTSGISNKSPKYFEINGKFYMFDGRNLRIFDGTSITALTGVPVGTYGSVAFIQGGKLKSYSYSNGTVYVYDETTDTWTEEATIGSKNNYYYFCNVGEDVYCSKSKELFKYENGAITKIATLSRSAEKFFVYKSCLYYSYNESTTLPNEFWKYDPATGTDTLVGSVPYNSNPLITLNGNLYCIFGSASDKMYIFKLHEVTE